MFTCYKQKENTNTQGLSSNKKQNTGLFVQVQDLPSDPGYSHEALE